MDLLPPALPQITRCSPETLHMPMLKNVIFIRTVHYVFILSPGGYIQKSNKKGRLKVKFLEQMKIQDFTNQVIVFLAAAKQIKAVPTTKAVFFKAAITDLLSYKKSLKFTN